MQVFSTTEVAKICGLSRRFIAKCVDSGKLKGYKIPGSNIRRIPRDRLIEFLKKYKMPLGNLESNL
jgi:excisionase family DNA binding protein